MKKEMLYWVELLFIFLEKIFSIGTFHQFCHSDSIVPFYRRLLSNVVLSKSVSHSLEEFSLVASLKSCFSQTRIELRREEVWEVEGSFFKEAKFYAKTMMSWFMAINLNMQSQLAIRKFRAQRRKLGLFAFSFGYFARNCFEFISNFAYSMRFCTKRWSCCIIFKATKSKMA